MRRWILGLVATAALAGSLAGCLAPTVPIPPPEPERISFSLDVEAGTARFSYQPTADYSGAVVYVFNRDAGAGVIVTADPDGAVPPSPPFPAQEGDEVDRKSTRLNSS